MELKQSPLLFDDEESPQPKIAPEVEKQIKKKVQSGRKKLKDAAGSSLPPEIPDEEELFKKQYYPIGDVAQMFNENTSLIRYWEKEFDILKPKKNRKGDRYFRPEDVKNLHLIYHLLRERKFTIEGAKEFLKESKAATEKFEMMQSLEKIKLFLTELKASL